jgi:hypothetical protein
MVNLDTFINKNEITRKDFDDLVANYKLETYSQESIHKYIESTSQLMEKGENDSLSSNEELAINIAKAEIGNLRKYVVLDVLEGQIVKVPMYVQEQMVDFEKGVYIDNSVNRKLGRVGRQWGGKKEEGKDDKSEENDYDLKVGENVKIPRNLTNDPNNRQGQSGKIVSIDSKKDEVVVEFENKGRGTYQLDAVEKQKESK